MYLCQLREKLLNLHGEIGDDLRRDGLFPTKNAYRAIAASFEDEDFEGIFKRVDNPIFLDACLGISTSFLVAVVSGGARRGHFHHQIRSASDARNNIFVAVLF